MSYSFEELIKDLDIGREIEFSFKTKKYYIGCGTGKYMYWEFNNEASEIIGKNPEELLSKVKVEGKLIKDIWEFIEIDFIF
jgi:hypothetical protein